VLADTETTRRDDKIREPQRRVIGGDLGRGVYEQAGEQWNQDTGEVQGAWGDAGRRRHSFRVLGVMAGGNKFWPPITG